MGAIDLLFAVKRDSERLHQLVLGALLARTKLLTRLVPLTSAPTQIQLQWDPEGKSYDLGLNLTFAGEEAKEKGRRGRVLVEMKLDSPVNEDRLAQQLSASRLHAEDRLLYFLLGHSAITSDRSSLRERVRRIGAHSGRPDLPDRVSLRDSADLVALLADPELLPDGPDHHDARDLAAAYRDALLALLERTRGYASHSVADWQEGDFYGFFAACRARGIAGMTRMRLGRAASADGAGVSCVCSEAPLCGELGHLDWQFENARLVLRLHATGDRKALRQRVLSAIADTQSIAAAPALLLSPAPPRLAAVMPLSFCDGLLAAFPGNFDWALFSQQMAAAEQLLRNVAAKF